jgi:hypothetical protein
MTTALRTPPHRPTSELVAVAWLTLYVPELPTSMVGTSLPKDTTKWADTGFLQVSSAPGGVPSVDLPVRHPILQLDAWATSNRDGQTSSVKPPWHLAAQILEAVRIATEGPQTGRYGRQIAVRENYLNVRVQAAYLVTEPAKVTDDPSGYAHFTADLAIDWVPT